MGLWSLSFLVFGPEGLLEARAGVNIAWVLPAQAEKDQCRIVGEPLLETQGAHARRDERVVGQHAAEGRGRVRTPLRSQRLQQQAGLSIRRIELYHTLEVLPCLLPSRRLAVDLGRHAVRLYVPWTRLEDHPELGQRRLRIAVVQVRLGQDQARRGV